MIPNVRNSLTFFISPKKESRWPRPPKRRSRHRSGESSTLASRCRGGPRARPRATTRVAPTCVNLSVRRYGSSRTWSRRGDLELLPGVFLDDAVQASKRGLRASILGFLEVAGSGAAATGTFHALEAGDLGPCGL